MDNHIWVVMTHSRKVMRVMKTEKGAKKYATQRGLGLVGRLVSRSKIDSVQRRGGVWGGLTRCDSSPITRYGWVPLESKRTDFTVCRGTNAINKHFGTVKNG